MHFPWSSYSTSLLFASEDGGRQWSKGIRQNPINWCWYRNDYAQITPAVDYNKWLTCLEIELNEPYNSMKIIKVVMPTNKKTLLYNYDKGFVILNCLKSTYTFKILNPYKKVTRCLSICLSVCLSVLKDLNRYGSP